MAALIEDVATHLQTSGVGTIGTNLFYSYNPPTPDSCVTVLDTGGSEPSADLPTKSPTFQVLIRAASYDAAKTLANSVRTALHQTNNTTRGTTFFYYILALQEPGHIGVDDNGRDEFSVNFRCLTK